MNIINYKSDHFPTTYEHFIYYILPTLIDFGLKIDKHTRVGGSYGTHSSLIDRSRKRYGAIR